MKKPFIFLASCGLIAGGIFLFMQFNKEKSDEPVAANAQPLDGMPEPPEKIQKLNALQQDLAKLSNEDLIAENDRAKAKLYENDLVKRMKKNNVTEEERAMANDLLVRMALIRVEKAKRGIVDIKPSKNMAQKDTAILEQDEAAQE